MDSLQRKCNHLYCPDDCSEVKRLEPLKLKAQIKDIKSHIRGYKKELKEAHKSEDWAALEYLGQKVDHLSAMLDVKTKLYKKESA